MNNSNTSLLDRMNNWLRESVMVKVVSIGILVLILLIPKTWVNSILDEREWRASEAINEVSQKWSGTQNLTGPVLVIPYKKKVVRQITTADKRIVERIDTTISEAYFLPHELNIKGELNPQNLHRGIFDVVVYHSSIMMDGYFEKPNIEALGLKNQDMLWSEAYLINGLSDLRGIGENPQIKWNNQVYHAEPVNKEGNEGLFNKNIAVKIKINPEDSMVPFSTSLSLKGSSHLYFYPLGKTTKVSLKGTWGNPSFDGFYLPETRNVDADLFSSTWKILSFNRPFPQQWADQVSGVEGTAFGVNLLMPVDQYQKSIRTSKYGILIIVLTFVSLLLMEIIVKIRIHPFQYTLIGAALIIYYTLLLSFSEHIGFNLAYLISAVAVVVLISLYSLTFFRKIKVAGLLAFLLTLFYAYIFVITQQQDYALLLGSIGLFLIISVLMYVSRKINWYGQSHQPE